MARDFNSVCDRAIEKYEIICFTARGLMHRISRLSEF
jgi:hypothetical protein